MSSANLSVALLVVASISMTDLENIGTLSPARTSSVEPSFSQTSPPTNSPTMNFTAQVFPTPQPSASGSSATASKLIFFSVTICICLIPIALLILVTLKLLRLRKNVKPSTEDLNSDHFKTVFMNSSGPLFAEGEIVNVDFILEGTKELRNKETAVARARLNLKDFTHAPAPFSPEITVTSAACLLNLDQSRELISRAAKRRASEDSFSLSSGLKPSSEADTP